MTGNRELFSVLDTSVGGEVRFGDNFCVEIEGRGSILLECKNGEQRLLTDILYIPYLKANVFSIGQAEEGGCEISIKDGVLAIFEQDGTLLMKTSRSPNRLYRISLKVGSPICLLSKAGDEAWLSHSRLGHVNFDTIKRLGTSSLVQGAPPIEHPSQLCEACLAGKHTRQSFPSRSNFRAEAPLDQVYADLCGPITPATNAGNRYILLFVDDHSRFMWPYMLKTKDEALEKFRIFKVLVENQYGKKIKVLRTDRGGEFTSNEFKAFCEQSGITRQLTAPYTPQQNGIVERRNQTVMSTTRSILNAMKMPQEFWAEAVGHSIYVLNRLPTKALKDQTPYEALKGNKPRVYHLKVFGCVGYVKTPSHFTKKLDDRSTAMVPLGIEPGTKAYRMYDVEGNRVVISRDVVFNETQSWDWNKHQAEDHSYQADFVLHTNPEKGPSTSDSERQSPEDSSPVRPQVGSPAQRNSPLSAGEASSSTTGSIFSSPKSTVAGRGPMLPESATRIYGSSDPSVAESETYDDTPPQGTKSLHEIYELLLTEGEPTSFKEAAGNREWEQAMETELASIEKNHTWELTDLPSGHRPIGLKWIYKIKRNASGDITRMETVRLILALAAQRGWNVHHLDVKTAFLHGELKEEVFVSQPEGYVKKGKERMVYKLSKALYGLKQASRAWNTKLDSVLKECEFQKCKLEQAVYIKRSREGSLLVGIYVDDLIVTGTSIELIERFKRQMERRFEMSDLGPLSYYLGLEVIQEEDGIKIKQSGYAKKILQQEGMWECNPTKYPMEPGLKLAKDDGSNLVDATAYRRTVGCLRYLTHSRPDLAYSAGYVSRYMQAPRSTHAQAVKQILRYIKGTVDLGIHYKKNGSNSLIGFSDSSLLTDSDDGKPEFMAATMAACQAIWLQGLLAEITGAREEVIVIRVDNKSAIDLMKNPVFHGRSKHIDRKYHFIRECVEKNKIKVEYVSGDQQPADILTKALPRIKFTEMREVLGVKLMESNRRNFSTRTSFGSRRGQYPSQQHWVSSNPRTPQQHWATDRHPLSILHIQLFPDGPRVGIIKDQLLTVGLLLNHAHHQEVVDLTLSRSSNPESNQANFISFDSLDPTQVGENCSFHNISMLKTSSLAPTWQTERKATPVKTSSKLRATSGDLLSDGTLHCQLARALQYPTIIRPDLTYAVEQICLFMHAPRDPHLQFLKWVLRYLKGTVHFGLRIIPSKSTKLTAYSHASPGHPNDSPLYPDLSAEAEYRGVANTVA
ncbi:hypothetical protein E3N88_44430 [Mikania micrantha]|uniref:Integrase catalytic domain-containing protein n=1 Tax=Mikania micrantha TaxID=192012 RepID=A0A5N6LCB6_9ASTR|nr:hypothetical protein E3N88_44430 [Mikania micrantha]